MGKMARIRCSASTSLNYIGERGAAISHFILFKMILDKMDD